jgi:hypothetical protein
MTEMKKKIVMQLEALVSQRFTIESLERELSLIFNEGIHVEDITDEKDGCDTSDYNFLFESKKESTYGFFDLYYLKTRDDMVYITEISYEFEE